MMLLGNTTLNCTVPELNWTNQNGNESNLTNELNQMYQNLTELTEPDQIKLNLTELNKQLK